MELTEKLNKKINFIKELEKRIEKLKGIDERYAQLKHQHEELEILHVNLAIRYRNMKRPLITMINELQQQDW